MKKILNSIKYFLEQIRKAHISEYTASCAYFTILAFIPLVMLIMTLAKYIGLDNEIVSLLFNSFIPNNVLNEAVLEIVKEVYAKSVGTITISAIFTLWSACKGFSALCRGLNIAYDIKNDKSFIHFRLKGVAWTVIFILVLFATLVLSVYGNRINNFLQEKYDIFNTLITSILKHKILIIVIILFITFTFMYRFIPKHKYKLKDQIPGALFSTLACTVISIFYSIYVNVFREFSFIYGSLTSIVLAIMWVYACMYSILIGAIINNLIIKSNKNVI